MSRRWKYKCLRPGSNWYQTDQEYMLDSFHKADADGWDVVTVWFDSVEGFDADGWVALLRRPYREAV